MLKTLISKLKSMLGFKPKHTLPHATPQKYEPRIPRSMRNSKDG